MGDLPSCDPNSGGMRQRSQGGSSSSLTHTAPSSSSSAVSSIVSESARLFSEYRLLVKNYPVRTKAITSLITAIVGEILGGAVRARRARERFSIDSKRITIFGLYGLVITGPILHYWYTLLEKITVGMGVKDVARTIVKLVIDRGLFGPPFVLLTVSFIQFLQSNFSFGKASAAVKRTFVAVLIANQKFWVLVQLLNFGVVPVDLQLLFVNIASIAWNTLLSLAS